MPSYFYTMSDKLKILACPANEGGCAYYRIIAPYKKIQELYPNDVEVKFDKNPLGINEKDGTWLPDFKFESMKWADIVPADWCMLETCLGLCSGELIIQRDQ